MTNFTDELRAMLERVEHLDNITVGGMVARAAYKAAGYRVGDVVRLRAWTGRIVDLLPSTTGGGVVAKLRLIKHSQGVYEYVDVSELARATVEDMQREARARLADARLAHEATLAQVNAILEAGNG